MAGFVTINEEICKGCGLCAAACPKGLLKQQRQVLNAKGYNPMAMTDQTGCIACAFCAVMCPDSAITVERK